MEKKRKRWKKREKEGKRWIKEECKMFFYQSKYKSNINITIYFQELSVD